MDISKATQEVKGLLPVITPMAKGFITSLGAAVAAWIVVPDHAVMTKAEIDDGVELSNGEKLLRKMAVPIIMNSLMTSAQNLMSANSLMQLFRTPGVESKIRATAKTMLVVPGFIMSYRLIKNKVDNTQTLNIRDVAMKLPLKTMAGLGLGGNFLNGFAAGLQDTPQGLGNVGASSVL